jgi:hypothetical protein
LREAWSGRRRDHRVGAVDTVGLLDIVNGGHVLLVLTSVVLGWSRWGIGVSWMKLKLTARVVPPRFTGRSRVVACIYIQLAHIHIYLGRRGENLPSTADGLRLACPGLRAVQRPWIASQRIYAETG